MRSSVAFVVHAARQAFARGVFDLSTSMILVMGLGFVQNSVLARLLGAEGLGHMAVINSVLNIAALLATAGVTTSILRYGAAEPRPDGAWAVYRSGLGLVAGVALASAAGVALFSRSPLWVFDPVAAAWMPLVALVLPAQALASCSLSFLQARDRMRDKAVLELIARVFAVSAVLIGAFLDGFPGCVIGLAIGIAVGSLVQMRHTRRLRAPGARPSVEPRELFRFGVWGLLTNALGLVLSTADVLSVSALVGDPKAVGIYSLASLFQQVVTIPMRAYLDTRFAEMTRMSADPAGLRAMRRRMRLHLLLITLAPALALAAIAPIALPWIFGAEFAASVPPLWILLVGQVVYSTGAAQGRSMLAAGWVEGNFWAAAGAAAFNLTANLTLVPALGVIGAAIATASTYAFWAAAVSWMCRWHERVRIGRN